MSIAACARNFTAAWCPRIPVSRMAARSTRLYVTADQPHQLSLIPDPEIDYGLLVQKKIDAVYVTRFQKERWTEMERAYPKIDAKFLDEAKYSDASVMHPLPRVNELDASFDTRSARGLFPAGRLWRSDPHGADLAAAAAAEEQVAASASAAASPSPTIRFTPSRSARACNATIPIASPAIRPNGNTPPTSSMWSKMTRRSNAGCAACIARKTSMRTRRATSSSPTRCARHLPPGLAAIARAPADKAQASRHLPPAKPTRSPPAFSRATSGKKVRAV